MNVPTLYEYYTSGGITAGLSATKPYFTLNHRNITIYSGAVHYFRVPQEYWSDRLRKMRAAGLNTVETYVPWNLHEPRPDEYDFGNGGSDFQSMVNLELFLQTAQKEDLFAIVRPGPYICAEWDFGGFPSWLLRKRDLQVRTSDPYFLNRVAKYFKVLFAILTALQFTKGGPIIAFQIENEYGSLKRKDMKYLWNLRKMIKRRGVVELLFTSDGPSMGNLGQMPGTLFTGNFQMEPQLELDLLQSYQPGKPTMVMEYWTGWFDHWGEPHNRVLISEFRYALSTILRFPASVNLYMFHGGTSFGFMNGANLASHYDYNNGYQPDTTSYDYDAPLSESGDYTEKYYETKRLLAKYNQIKTRLPKMPPLINRTQYHTIEIISQLTLEEAMAQVPHVIRSPIPIPMEFLPINNNAGQSYGYIVYRKENIFIPANSRLKIIGRVCDSAQVLINGELKSKPLETLSDLNNFGFWRLKNATLLIDGEYFNATLDIIVENWGRVNFGSLHQFQQFKGIWQGAVELNDCPVKDWLLIPLEFQTNWTNNLNYWHTPRCLLGPALYKAELIIRDDPQDTFIDMRDWTMGIIIVNGFVLSRYMKLGPQQTAYLPAPFLKTGINEIIIFEHFENAEYVVFSHCQLYQNIEINEDIYKKTINVYIAN